MTLISIIDSYHTNILGIFFNFKQDVKKHILVSYKNNNAKTNFQNLKNGQTNFKRKYSYKFKLEEKEIDLECEEYKIFFKGLTDKNILINITNATPELILFLNKETNHQLISYDKYNNKIKYYKEGTRQKTEEIVNKMNIEEQCILKGFEVISNTPEFGTNFRKEVIYKLTNDMGRLQKYIKEVKKDNSNMSADRWREEYNLLKSINKHKNVHYLYGTLFEEYIFLILSESKYFDDVKTSILLEHKNGFKNEIDVMVIKDNHLHAIECKFRENFKGIDFIYKLDSILSNYDSESKGVILAFTNEKSVTERKLYTTSDIKRANINNIYIYNSFNNFDKDKFLVTIKKYFKI